MTRKHCPSCFSAPLPTDLPWRAAFRLSTTASLTQAVRYATTLVMMVFAARYLDTAGFAGVTMGMAISNIVLLTYCVSVSMVLDTVTTAEFGRNPDSPALGSHLRLAVLAIAVALLPILVLTFWFARPILALIFSAELATAASEMLRFTTLFTTPLGLFFTVQKWLAAQRIVSPPLAAQCVNVLTLTTTLWLTRQWASIPQVALCLAAGRTAGVTALVLLSRRWYPETIARCGTLTQWLSLHRAAFEADAREFLRAIGHSFFICAAERWSFEMLVMLAGTLGPAAVDAYQIGNGAPGMFFVFAVGSYVAANTGTGNGLGAGDSATAKKYALTAVAICVVPSVAGMLFMLFLPQLYVSLYTSDAAVAGPACRVAQILSMASVVDNLGYVLQGVLRGCNEMAFLSTVIALSHWAVNVPLAAAMLKFTHYGVAGVASASVLALSVVCAVSGWRLSTIDWERKAIEIARKGEGAESPAAAVDMGQKALAADGLDGGDDDVENAPMVTA